MDVTRLSSVGNNILNNNNKKQLIKDVCQGLIFPYYNFYKSKSKKLNNPIGTWAKDTTIWKTMLNPN